MIRNMKITNNLNILLLLIALLVSGAVNLASAQNGCPSSADYRFQNAHTSSVGSAPALTDIGAGNTFVADTVNGVPTTVLQFPRLNGLQLQPTTGIVSNEAYTIDMLFKFAEVTGYRRVLDFKNGTSDNGIYVLNGKIRFHGGGGTTGSTNIAANTYNQLTVSRTVSGVVTLYINGLQELTFNDTTSEGVINPSNALRFFKDDGTGESSGGSVARIQLYNCGSRAMSAPSNLSAWYTGEGDARDAVGSNNGTLVSGTKLALGKIGQAFEFDGMNDLVTTNLDVQPSAMPTTTWEAWVYPTRTFGNRQTILSGDGGSFDRAVIIEANTSNFGIFDGEQPWQPTTMNINQWQHIAVIYTPTNILFYKNGVEFSRNAAPLDQSSAKKFVIGANQFSNPAGSQFFQGKIDEVSVYNRQLTIEEVRAIYNAGANGKMKQTAFTSQMNVQLAAATINFPSAQSGMAEEQGLDSSNLPPIPSGTPLLYYDVSTNAPTLNASVCFNVSALTSDFANLHVYHLENNVWVDRTLSTNTSPNLCTGALPSLSPFAIARLLPTASTVTVGGRVMTADQRGIRNAMVTLTRADGTSQTILTGKLGHYRFTDIEAGQSVIISVSAKRFTFEQNTSVISLMADTDEINFTAKGNGTWSMF